jgi:hypothetical protein
MKQKLKTKNSSWGYNPIPCMIKFIFCSITIIHMFVYLYFLLPFLIHVNAKQYVHCSYINMYSSNIPTTNVMQPSHQTCNNNFVHTLATSPL